MARLARIPPGGAAAAADVVAASAVAAAAAAFAVKYVRVGITAARKIFRVSLRGEKKKEW